MMPHIIIGWRNVQIRKVDKLKKIGNIEKKKTQLITANHLLYLGYMYTSIKFLFFQRF